MNLGGSAPKEKEYLQKSCKKRKNFPLTLMSKGEKKKRSMVTRGTQVFPSMTKREIV